MKILVLMATFNGAEFLTEQIDSIRRQTISQWQLLIRDDGSTDRTPALLHEFAQDDPRIRIIDHSLETLGPAGNFSRLMSLALREQADAFAFSDQDDIWEPHKLERQLSALAELHQQHGKDSPALVYSDLTLIDAGSGDMAALFMTRQHIHHPDCPPLLTLLLQNHVVGCSMLMNRPLLVLAAPVPDSAHMHDWWVALCASAAGANRYLPEPLLRYRQHVGSQVGAHGIAGRLRRPRRWLSWLSKMVRLYRCSFEQAAELQCRLDQRMHASQPSSPPAASLDTLNRLLALTVQPRRLRPIGLLKLSAHCQNALLTGLLYTFSATVRLPCRSPTSAARDIAPRQAPAGPEAR